jgi:hypothetical protein
MVPLEEMVLEQVVQEDLVAVVLLVDLLDPDHHLKEMLVELVDQILLILEVAVVVPVELVVVDLLVAQVVSVLKCQPHSEIQFPHQVLEVDHKLVVV